MKRTGILYSEIELDLIFLSLSSIWQVQLTVFQIQEYLMLIECLLYRRRCEEPELWVQSCIQVSTPSFVSWDLGQDDTYILQSL